MFSIHKTRQIAAILALMGTIIPIAGIHKFYLGQKWWGIAYLMLSWTPIPHIASAIEAVWYLTQDENQFDQNFNQNKLDNTIGAKNVIVMAEALRQLEQLRQEGLISEYEFEQKRREIIDN
ncbi:MAG TPA: NINE protein [Allocoleopsis sp.]